MNSVREATNDELKIMHKEVVKEYQDLKITNELLIKEIKLLREEKSCMQCEIDRLKNNFSILKKEDIERKKEKLLNHD
jgi:hypothetical protein